MTEMCDVLLPTDQQSFICTGNYHPLPAEEDCFVVGTYIGCIAANSADHSVRSLALDPPLFAQHTLIHLENCTYWNLMLICPNPRNVGTRPIHDLISLLRIFFTRQLHNIPGIA
jgi:hypothetical protein